MRPLYLKIEGIKSVAEEQTIDFEKVAKNGIFGIFGKTGSGKSTILDSIVLALYGEIISNVDNSDFINNSKNKGRVELTFSILVDGESKKYLVEREYKFVGKNRTLTSNAKLWEITEAGQFAIAEGSKGVTECIKERIVGLSKSEFLKCIALPQGEFSSFIKMTRNERLLIIGKLFDLEKYGAKLYRNFKRQDDEYSVLENKLLGEQTALSAFSSEVVENLKEELKTVAEEYEKISAEVKAQTQKCNALNYTKKLIEERNEKSEEKREKLRYKSNIDEFVKNIERFDKVKTIEKELNTLEEINLKISKDSELLKKLKIEEDSLLKRREELLKSKELLPLKQEQLLSENIKFQNILAIQEKCDKLAESQKYLTTLREKHKVLTNSIKENTIKIDVYKKEADKNSALAKECNIEKCLFELANSISGNLLSTYAKERLQFLKDLGELLSKNNYDNLEINILIKNETQNMLSLVNKSQEVELRDLLSSTLNLIEQTANYSEQEQKALTNVKTLTAQNQLAQTQLLEVKEQGEKERQNYDKLLDEINGVLNGKSVEVAKLEIKKSIENLTNEIKAITLDNDAIAQLISENLIRKATCEANLLQLQSIYEQNKTAFDLALENAKVSENECKVILSKANEIERQRQIVKDHETSILLIEKRIGELNEQLKDNVFSLQQIEIENQKLGEMQKNCQKLAEKRGEINNDYQNSLKNNQRWCIINNNLKEISTQRKSVGKMIELVKENRFMEFIAEEYLKDIASIAENRVLTLTSGRYGLEYKNGAFYVSDNLSGGKLRPAIGLSGGETFLVSLSLALALSSQISAKALRPLDFFFLDEGFGTLDDDLIDAVTDSLEKLQKANLTVGLITHVVELKNRIQSRIEVTGATALHGTLIKDNC
ncbi:MAG: SMC family ATPase [Clostridia bacterium]|nr:SMC family ATPase [Clostridia bacterium]